MVRPETPPPAYVESSTGNIELARCQNTQQAPPATVRGSTAPESGPPPPYKRNRRCSCWERRWRLTCFSVGCILSVLVTAVATGVVVGMRDAPRSRQSSSSSSSTSPTSTTMYPELTPIPTAEPYTGIRPERDFSVTTDETADVAIVWELVYTGNLSWRLTTEDSEWHQYETRTFLIAPVIVDFSPGQKALFSIDGSTSTLVCMVYKTGAWNSSDWIGIDLGGEFKDRPSGVSLVEGWVDLFIVHINGSLMHLSYAPLEGFADWEIIGNNFMGDAAVTSWGPDRMDVFASDGLIYYHRSWTRPNVYFLGGWADSWTNLGGIGGGKHLSWPLTVSFGTENHQMDVIMVIETDLFHRRYVHNAPTEWQPWEALPYNGFADTQVLVRGGDEPPYAHLFSRGTDNCIHYSEFTGNFWEAWNILWCSDTESVSLSGYQWPTRYFSLAAVNNAEGALHVVNKEVGGYLDYSRIPLPFKYTGVNGCALQDLGWSF